MLSRHLISRLAAFWRNLTSYFAWPEPKPTLKRHTVKRSTLAIDALEDRTTPTILWGTPDFLMSSAPYPGVESFKPQEISLVRTIEKAAAETPPVAAFSATQVAQVDRLLDCSPMTSSSRVMAPLPAREYTQPARDALFAQLGEEPAMTSGHTVFPTLKHRAAPHPAMIGAMALVAVPLVMSNKSRNEESERGDGPRKPFPRTIRL